MFNVLEFIQKKIQVLMLCTLPLQKISEIIHNIESKRLSN